MGRTNWRGVVAPLLGVLGFASTLVTLVTGFPQIGSTLIGRIFLILLCIASFCYLAIFTYMSVIRAYWNMKKCLGVINTIVMQFTSTNANSSFTAQIDPDLINLIIASKRMASATFGIVDLRFIANNSIQILIDKGFDDGIRDGMKFKIFHNARWAEIGVCGCTVTFKQTMLVIPIGPNCPVHQSEIKPENIEIRVIEPVDNSKINHLLASLQVTLDN